MRKKLLLLISVLLISLFFVGCGKIPTEFAPPSNSKDGGVSSVSATTYTCNVGEGGTGDYCDVQGFVNNMDISTTSPKVIIRYDASDLCVGYDFNGDGILEGRKVGGKYGGDSGCSQPCFYADYIMSNGLGFNFEGIRPGVGYDGGNTYKKIGTTSCSIDTSTTPKSNCQYPEYCDTPLTYTVDWNFCPSGDSNFAYCDGANAVRTQTNPVTGSTTETRLNEGQLLQFDPRDGNNNPLPQDKFYLRVQKWDMSCNTDYTGKCDVNSQNVYCKPKSKPSSTTCPDGTFLTNNVCCPSGTTFIADSVKCSGGTKSNVCRGDTSSCWLECKYNCYSPLSPTVTLSTSDYTYHSPCGSTNSDGCPVWSNSIQQCTDGKKCYVGDVLKEGEGQCKCSPTECNKGDRRLSQLGGEYDECVQVSSSGCDYNEWQGKTCPNSPEFHYDQTSKKCINNANDPECQPYATYKKCVGNDLYSCISNGIKDENNNYRWYLTLETKCQSPKECIDSGNFDYCGCKCTSGQIRCISSETEYEVCGTSCWENKPIPSDKLCRNNALVDKSTIDCTDGGTKCPSGTQCNTVSRTCVNTGCAYGTETCDSSIGKMCDTNQASPTYNTCICKDDQTYCRNRVGELKCSGVKSYKQCVVSSTTCPYWSAETQCDSYGIKSCKDQTGSDTCNCPTPADGNEWCDIVQASTETKRCSLDKTTVEKCEIVNGCPSWQNVEDCSIDGGLICVE